LTLFCLQSKLIGAADQSASPLDVNSSLNFSGETRSTQAEFAEAQKYQSQQARVLPLSSFYGSKFAEIKKAPKKNITQASANQTISDQNAQFSILDTASLYPTAFSEEAPKSGLSQTLEAQRAKAKLPKLRMKS
jgi:hypothetical protein